MFRVFHDNCFQLWIRSRILYHLAPDYIRSSPRFRLSLSPPQSKFVIESVNLHVQERIATINMSSITLADTVSELDSVEEWGPETVTETTLDGVPYAPYSKGDKLGRMADWTTEGKDREGRGRQQYQRNYRGKETPQPRSTANANGEQINRFMVPAHPLSLRFRSPKMNPPSPL